jgi:RNA polymerase sigma-70 factor (ECF subfamily)
MDDDELIAAVAGGDDAGLRELFSRHAPWLAARLRGVLPAGGRHVADPAEAAVSRAELAEAVSALGPAGSLNREAWRLMYVEDRPVAEVAELMGVPEGTVKSRAHRARKQLRAALQRREPARDGGGR